MSGPIVRRRNTVLAAIEAVRRLDAYVSTTSLLVFLYVCENPGLNIRELSQVAGLTEATASRAVLGLTERAAGRARLALVRVEANPNDGRGRILFLTERGLALRERLDGLIAGATPILTSDPAA